MGKSILEEAVDDVQALRKAAEESAKTMFIESMSPRIEKFIQSQLGESVDASVVLDPSAIDGAPVALAKDKGADADVPDHHDLEADEDAEADDVDDDEDEVEFDVENDSDEDEEEEEDETPDDEDDDLQEAADDDEDDDDDQGDGEPKKKKKFPFQKKGKMKDETVEISDKDMKEAFMDVLKAGLKEDSTMGKFSDAQDPNDGEYGLAHKVPGEVTWADGAKVIKKSKNAKMVTKESHNKMVQKLYQQLAVYQEALKYYKKNLHEMNVFNAKLVYTTKLLQNNLSNKQKVRVVEAIDKAKTKSQVETIYEALSESLKIAGVMNEGRSKIKGPKGSRVTKPGSTLNEGRTQDAVQSNRWAELAGLTE